MNFLENEELRYQNHQKNLGPLKEWEKKIHRRLRHGLLILVFQHLMGQENLLLHHRRRYRQRLDHSLHFQLRLRRRQHNKLQNQK
jgi:hypothetical protein